MKIEIVSVKVLLTNATDRILVKTKYPCPFVPEALPSQPDLELQFDATYDTGVEYCRNTLDIEPQIINLR